MTYGARGASTVWICENASFAQMVFALIEPKARAIEIYTLRGASYLAVAPERDGSVRSPVLGVELSTIAGPKLRVSGSDGSAEI